MLPGEAVCGRGDVGVAAVEIETVHAFAARGPFRKLLRFGWILYVVDGDPAAQFTRRAGAFPLVIDDHDVVGDAHLVGVPARREGPGGRAISAEPGRPRRRWRCRWVGAYALHTVSTLRPTPGRRRGNLCVRPVRYWRCAASPAPSVKSPGGHQHCRGGDATAPIAGPLRTDYFVRQQSGQG